MELGIPRSPAICDHSRPEFGCSGCITRDKTQMLVDLKKRFKPGDCDECGCEMEFYDMDILGGKLIYVCKDTDWDGESRPSCDGYIEVRP